MRNLRIFLAGVNLPILPARTVSNILFNVADDGRDAKTANRTRNLITFARTEKTMLDSSGYQVLQGELQGKQMTFDPCQPLINTKERINLSPAHVIEAACNIQPDILVGLDYPIRKLKTEEQDEEYLLKSKFNARWARESASLRQRHCPQIQLFLPVQAYTLDNFNHYLTLIPDVNCDGLSMPIRNLKISDVALFFIKFHQMGIRRVHLLGTTSFPMIALCAYFARHFFDWTSLDATTWRFAAQHNRYLSPLDLSGINLLDDFLDVRNLQTACQCPFCANRTFEYVKQLSYPERVALVRSHNWYAIEKAAIDLYTNATDTWTFEKFLRSRSQKVKVIEELIQCLSIVDIYRDVELQVLESILGSIA